MNAPPSADRRGEGFAFFRWAVSLLIPERICVQPTVGWKCLYCREEWKELQEKHRGT